MNETSRYRHALAPIAIGPVTVPNRVVRTGHGTGLGGGTISDDLIAYHAARAKGGVGLTILELMSVGSSAYPLLHTGNPGVVEGYAKLMEAVRPHGMRIFQQLGHLGNEIPEADGGPPRSSSDSIGALVGMRAVPLTLGEIEQLKQCYLAAVQECIAGGIDGVELHMAHGYLLQQFMSPLYNRRTDQYGGSFENRVRLPLELLRLVREALPAHMALGVRLSSEMLPGGMGPDEVIQIASLFQSEGLIDYLNLSMGTDYNPHKIIGAMHEAAGYELEADLPVTKHATVPTIVTGRFRTLEEVDQVIAQGQADMVAMNRATIADPNLVAKSREGNEEDVRPCIGCNHGCIGGLLSVGRIGCAVNPAAGLERMLSEDGLGTAEKPLRVLIVGGGPAGMEAARVARLRGHDVTLCEAASRLGGAADIARRAPRRQGLGDIADWLEREIYRLGVDVRLSTYVQADDVREMAPDVLIVATGSLPPMDGRQMFEPAHVADGMEQRIVVSSHDLLMDRSNRDWGKRAVVFDDAGHYEAVAAAEFLVEKGLAVTFATSHPQFAPGIVNSLSAEPALQRLAKGDFRLITYARLESVGAASARIGLRYGGKAEDVEADTVVVVGHNVGNRDLVDELGDTGAKILIVGDAKSPRYLQTAIREGHLAARGL